MSHCPPATYQGLALFLQQGLVQYPTGGPGSSIHPQPPAPCASGDQRAQEEGTIQQCPLGGQQTVANSGVTGIILNIYTVLPAGITRSLERCADQVGSSPEPDSLGPGRRWTLPVLNIDHSLGVRVPEVGAVRGPVVNLGKHGRRHGRKSNFSLMETGFQPGLPGPKGKEV